VKYQNDIGLSAAGLKYPDGMHQQGEAIKQQKLFGNS